MLSHASYVVRGDCEEEMRHPERELKDRETIMAILEKSLVGRIATVSKKGIPVIKPVNFLYRDRRVYIHSSPKGEKVKDIRRGSQVCFEVDEPIAYVTAGENACSANYYFRSIIMKGEASLVRQEKKKLEILERLMEKYQPEKGYGKIPEKILKKTAIMEIVVKKMTAKERLG
jgi:nitroimidazol reductase NimA-like FMN-containing flavoprotein (pyridoxamine 5'-phosphate oxidase superfamily)